MDPPALSDGRFTADQLELMRAMVPVGAPPPDPTNRYEDHPLAASLGARIFRDTMLSSNGMVSCSTCHDAATAFVDGRKTGRDQDCRSHEHGTHGRARQHTSCRLPIHSPRGVGSQEPSLITKF